MMRFLTTLDHVKLFVVGLWLFIVSTGCVPSDRFDTFKAEGKVTLNGKALSDAHVWLLPKDAVYKEAVLVVRPQGRTGRDGSFVLTTYLQDDGAPVGDYSAIVLHGDNDPDAAPDESQMKSARIAVPMKYKDAKTSGLDVTIKSGGANVIALDLKTK